MKKLTRRRDLEHASTWSHRDLENADLEGQYNEALPLHRNTRLIFPIRTAASFSISKPSFVAFRNTRLGPPEKKTPLHLCLQSATALPFSARFLSLSLASVISTRFTQVPSFS